MAAHDFASVKHTHTRKKTRPAAKIAKVKPNMANGFFFRKNKTNTTKHTHTNMVSFRVLYISYACVCLWVVNNFYDDDDFGVCFYCWWWWWWFRWFFFVLVVVNSSIFLVGVVEGWSAAQRATQKQRTKRSKTK